MSHKAPSLSGLALLTAGLCVAPTVPAGVTLYKDGDRFLEMGGRLQLQYHNVSPEVGASTDELFFRRLRPYIEAGLYPNWSGKIEWDMGEAEGDNELKVKDAYMKYSGRENAAVLIGNSKTPFSREHLTSSKYQQLVERTFVGDHNYGAPDRLLGLNLEGQNAAGKMTYAVALGSESLDPDEDKLDFDTPANTSTDWNQGWILAGRLDFHPFGKLKMAQGDFSGERKATLSIAAFAWNNDDDNNTNTAGGVDLGAGKPDIDTVTGLELSGAYRGGGWSIDAEYNKLDADTIDTGYTGGLYLNGTTSLETLAVEGGYMIVPKMLEIVAGYESLDADNYAQTWTRTSLGANWFLHGHDIKAQLTYRANADAEGIAGNDSDELFLQGQYVF